MSEVRPIPEGVSTLIPRLRVRGCAAALEFYKYVLGAVEVRREQLPNGMIVQAELKIAESWFYVADDFNPTPTTIGGVSLNIWTAEPEAIFERAAERGARILRPLELMFWGHLYGQFIDPWGHVWAATKEIEDLSDEEIHRRAEEHGANMSAEPEWLV